MCKVCNVDLRFGAITLSQDFLPFLSSDSAFLYSGNLSWPWPIARELVVSLIVEVAVEASHNFDQFNVFKISFLSVRPHEPRY